MSSWSCPYQGAQDVCQRVKRECRPGMKGCVLRGKVRFAGDEEPLLRAESTKPKKTGAKEKP